MPDDHSKLVPLLPIPNRTVKRLSADDSAGSRVKVGHCQALTVESPVDYDQLGFFYWAFNILSMSDVRSAFKYPIRKERASDRDNS